MDVRHYAFLARQPSAVVKTREHFWGMPKRGLAFLLANVMFWQPMWAQADGIVVATPGTSLGQAGNGVPIVNIATPNGTGLSHNQFHDYNVGTQGVILNNVAAQTGTTQLGGIIVGNPNLTNRVAAQTILNEVVGGSPSQLRGYTEVAGQSARVIVANPYGISCNGCGFINTPRVTLTTGKPVLDGGGRLDRFQVDQGSIAIDGAGLNATNVDRFEIITRSAKINAEIQASNLTLIAGRNDVNADSLNATARADDGSAKPGLAIDSSALGGMYAGAIKLVGTEQGVGVKLAGNLAASGGDIQIDANGHLTLAQTSATGAVNVKAASLDGQGPVYAGSALNVQTQGNLTNQQTLAARDSITLSAGGELTNNGIIEAGVNADNSRNAKGDVNLTAHNLNNTGKSVVASRNLTVNTAQTLTNQGGTLSAGQNANLTAGTLDNQNNGRVLSSGALNMAANQVLNGKGLITSTGNISATVGHLNNSHGELSTLTAATLRMQTLDNVAGLVNAGKALSITATGGVNNQGGKLTSLDSLSLNAGKVDNSGNGQIASNKTLTASVSSLDQHDGGQLTSDTSLTLDLNHGVLNNQSGLINAPLLVLKNLQQVDNRNGEISSAQAFTLAADSLDNSNGKLLGNQAVTLRVQQALTNIKGLIAAAYVDVQAGSLNNNGGTMTSLADLDLQVNGQLDNQDQGLINATDNLTINTASLNNQNGGSFLGSAIAIDFNGAMGDLNNAKGLITTTGQLSIRNLRDLNNQGGELSSSQSYTLVGRNLDNSDGKLISRQQLDLTADTTTNLNGLISGWQGLSLLGGSLDNRNEGTLSSRDGDVLVDLSGAVRNSNAGALVSHGTLKVTAASLDNSDKGILSSGGAQTFVIAGTLDNSQGGLIDSGAGLDIQATLLNNANATINAQQGISFTGTDLNNGAGILAGNGAVSLDLLGTLTNTNGQLASLGPMVITRANQINNQGGKLASQGLLSLLTSGLDNRNGGTVAGNDLLTLTASGAVQNSADGLIFSRDAGLTLSAASLDNAKGSLQSQGDLTIDTGAAIDNQSGRIVAKDGNLDITAASLDSRGGVLSSLQGAFSSHITGVLRNGYDLNNNRQGGIIQAQSLDLKALAVIDNYGGRITAQTGDAIIDTGTNGNFDNRNGGLYAKGRVSVTGKDFDNSGDADGQIGGQQVDLSLRGALNNRLGIIESESTLTITAASLDNQTGQLRALGSNGKTAFTIGGVFDNRNGTVESANSNLSLGTGSLLNVGGNVLHVGTGIFDIATGLLGSAGGSFVTRGGLTLAADGWTNSSVIQADRLTVNINNLNQTANGQLLAVSQLTGSGSNWNNDGLIASDGNLKIDLGGTYSGSGRVSSLGTLGVSAAQLNLNAAASIAGGGDTTVSVGGQLNNAGRLTSAANLTVNAGGLYNSGTLGSGQGLTVTTGSLVNDHGLIFSGGNMSLRVNALNNLYANIYSLGNLTIDRNGQGAQAASIVNSSASIQSDGSMSLAASTIQNIRAVLTTNNQGIYTAKIDEIACIEGVNAGDCSGKQNHVWEIVQREKLEVTAASVASSITAGGNLTLSGDDLLNQSSTIATGGNLSATLVNLTNSGVETGETETTRIYRSERTRNAGGWYSAASAFTNQYWYESGGYNANDLSGLQAGMANFIGMTEMEYPGLGSTRKIASSDQSYAAVIQAAGAININAQNNIDNTVVRPGYTYVGSGPRTGTGSAGSQYSTRITLNQQLPPDLAQQQVNPVSLPGFSLPTSQNGLFRLSQEGSTSPTGTGPQSWNVTGATVTGGGSSASAPFTINRVQGLPSNAGKSQPHKYLIETNPVLTDLKQFMSSDYLLSNLGYDPDNSAKRLGDGLYEQRLIQQAVVARTGQRFIDGQTSDEGLFKYLMNNAIASKTELNLSLGVSLTSEQVAALTHDIVWMENAEVNGEQVLVPVLYLANANNRLAANGALIQGSDVTLIAGKDLNNAGTLRSSQKLEATAKNDLVSSGLVEAGNRLDLLATNNLTNKAGGIIAGRDVSLTATQGDVINERTVTIHQSSSGYRTEQTDFVDNAARIEAANNLTLKAGRDVNNVGSVLKSGADTTITAGRDVNITSAEQIVSGERGLHRNQTITQYGSDVDVGQDLKVTAGRDLAVIGSQLDAKRDVSMNAAGDLTLASAADEQHSYSKTKKVTSQEDHVSQVSTTVTAGGNITLSAGKDLDLIASRASAGDEAYLFAGDNVNMTTAENVDYSYYTKTKKGSWGKKKSTMSETETDVSVSSSVSATNKLVISAGEDFNATGAKLKSDGTLLATAGGDINLNAAQDYASEASASSKKGWTSSKSSSSEVNQTRLNSTELVGKNIELKADNDISLKAAALRAEEGVKLTAGNDVLIGADQETQTSAQSKGSSKAGVTVTGWLSSTQKSQQGQTSSTQSIGSDISGSSIQIKSGRDTTVEGSTLVADKDIGINAGRNLDITSAQNTETSSSKSGSKKIGEVGASWWQGATGVLKQKETEEFTSTRQSGSQIASLGGNISLTAGDHYTQTASQLVAPQGDIGITAKHVDIVAGYDTLESTKTASTSRTAIGGTVSIPLLDALRGIQQMGEAAQKTSDDRMVALAAVNAAMSAKQAVDAGQALMNAPKTGGKISVNLSDSRSHSESSQSGRNVVASDVVAGGNVKVVATGDGANSDINVVGSRIEGGGDVNLKADGKINLLSAQNTAHQESTNGNSGWSAGIGIGFGGAQNGISFELAANVGRGMADGDDVTQTNTYIKGGNSVKLESGGDTNIKGGVVSADQVKVKVGGDLNIESLQDTSTYTSKQMSANVGVNICVPPICAGMSSVSGGVAAQHMQSDYASVSEQSGIKAGNGGFQVEVAGNTDLKGAVIASTDKAVADGKNTLETGTLTTSDIKNKAEYDATSINLSGGYGGQIGLDGKGNASSTANANGPKVPSKGGWSANTPVVLYAGDSSSSTTYSGISGAAVTITNTTKQQALTGQTAEQAVAAINTDVSSDRDGSNKLKPIFGAQEIGVDFEIVGKFVQNVSQYIASRAQEIDQKKEQAEEERALMNAPGTSEADQLKHLKNYQALKQEIRDIDENWGAGGTYRQIATALVAGISGNVAGSSAQFAQNMVVNYVQQQGSAYIGELVKKGLKEGSPEHAALHAILGCAGAAASNQSCSAGALGGSAASVLAGLFADADPNETAVEREAKRNLITSLVTGIAAMSNPNGAATANNAATANIDNNWLATQQVVQAQKELEEAKSEGLIAQAQVIAKWAGTSVKQDALTTGGIGLGIAEAGLQDVEGLSQFLAHPIEGLQGLASAVNDPAVRSQLGEAATASLLASIDRMTLALETGGDDQAIQLGRDLGMLIYTVGSVVTGVGGAAKAGLTLAKVGIEVSSKALGKMLVKDSAELGERVAALEIKTTKNLDTGTGGSTNRPPPVNSGVPAINELAAIEPTVGGYVSATKLNASSYAITDLTPAEKALAVQVTNGADRTGALTEQLVESVAQRQGLQVIEGGKYGSNNGFDHVYLRADGKSVIVLDSKQINGGVSLSKGADDIVQMSDAWIEKVLNKLDKNSDAFKAIYNATQDGSLIKGLMGVDRSTGQLMMAKLK
ncbi:filamentous hemagglutinin [Pseudomonas sp. SJZ080]|uniref:hemagglutinin repeat-containing protein n=1 Tax=Pseudomonas sp. SJZ080 TaxID=2572888 RepID=UPI00119A451C|nr:hemagglutinin repeat-containing protein [Pseudomonas sp. SJZ080]TWC49163.1 filamentous hemagglutinin [Pseudomonas sp. SJZ080]